MFLPNSDPRLCEFQTHRIPPNLEFLPYIDISRYVEPILDPWDESPRPVVETWSETVELINKPWNESTKSDNEIWSESNKPTTINWR